MAEKMKFEIDYCDLCEADFVRCPKCGNNCCNGGYGTVNGVDCDVCPLAYEYQKLYHQFENYKEDVKFPKECERCGNAIYAKVET